MWWCFWAVFFGLLQLWCLLAMAILDRHLSINPACLIFDCGLVFFSTTLATTFALDFAFARRTSANLMGDFRLYIIFPLIIIILSILVYAVCSVGTPDFWPITLLQIAVFLATCAYAVTVKRLQFARRFQT